jgi:ABC-type transport system substrate-binding protein
VSSKLSFELIPGDGTTIQLRFQIVDVLQKALSPNWYIVQSPTSSPLTLANPQLSLGPWLATKW